MILVVEDEPGILDIIERGLDRQGFVITTATDGVTGLQMALEPTTDLVVLDLMLPQMTGEEVLSRLRRRRPELPVIILTARGELEERVAGLNAGAVDYMVKPFALEELGARVRAQLRLASRGERTLDCAGVRVNLITRQVSVADCEVRLSTTEFELLVHLMQNRGRVLARDEILNTVWGYTHDPGTNVLDVYVGYLRRKLTAAGIASPIETIRARGYRFDAA